MIGTNLSLDLPSVNDTMSVMVAKTRAALDAIQTSIADKATPAALTINTALDLGGNGLVDVTSVRLVAGNTPTAAGSLYYSAGEFYAIDSTGTVQLTSLGAISAAGIGGIGGDYGGSNPATVNYDNASAQYRFRKDGSNWADIVAKDLILEGANGTVKFGVDAAISTGRIFNIKDIPASGVSVLVYNASTSALEDAQNTRATNVVKVTDLNVSGTATIGNVSYSGSLSYSTPVMHAVQFGGGSFSSCNVEFGAGAGSGATPTLHSSGASWGYMSGLLGRVGEKITSLELKIITSISPTVTVIVHRYDVSTDSVAVDATWSVPIAGAGYYQSGVSTTALGATEHYVLTIAGSGAGSGEEITAFRYGLST